MVTLYLVLASYSVFFTDYGVIGLAAATSLVALLEMMLFIVLLHRKIKGIIGASFLVPQSKMLLSSFLMAISLYLPFRVLDELVFNTTRSTELLALTIITTTIGFLVYIYFSALLQVTELRLITRLSKHFSFWKGGLSKTEELVYEPGLEDRDT